MKILHTADWHIGQLFHQYDRTWEHQQFLNWLVDTLRDEQIDVLLISGDIFDVSNPSAVSTRLFYTFLHQATHACPTLQVIVTAGNHDSPSRLETPNPILQLYNVQIVGLIEKDEEGSVLYDKLVLPLKDSNSEIKAWCLAVPFLRMGDYPVLTGVENAYADGVTQFYREAVEVAKQKRLPGQALIAMGHLHAQQADVGDLDQVERPIMGGVECISAATFDPAVAYVALGHIHKAQSVGGKDHIRYSGSPLPMSFTEHRYVHQVVVVELEDEGLRAIRPIPVPVSIPLLRVPAEHQSPAEALAALAALPDQEESDTPPPYLEVRVLCDGPEPSLKQQVQEALEGKQVRLAKIDARRREVQTHTDGTEKVILTSEDKLKELKPVSLLQQVYELKYGQPLSDDMIRLFNEVVEQVHQQEG